jgi:hypothetical protein
MAGAFLPQAVLRAIFNGEMKSVNRMAHEYRDKGAFIQEK